MMAVTEAQSGHARYERLSQSAVTHYLSHDIDKLNQQNDEPSKGGSIHHKHGNLHIRRSSIKKGGA